MALREGALCNIHVCVFVCVCVCVCVCVRARARKFACLGTTVSVSKINKLKVQKKTIHEVILLVRKGPGT